MVIALAVTGCYSPEYSPWQSDIDHHDLTKTNLRKLKNGSLPFTIAITGDPQAVVGDFDEVKLQINKRRDVSFSVVLGDITDRGLKREWNLAADIINSFDKPVLTVVGNHDGLSNAKSIYPKMFGPYNYSFYYGGVKFVMWNNNFYEWGDPDFDWLEKEVLDQYPVIVMSHQPPYSGTLLEHHEDRWYQIRSGGDIIASLHGHQHSWGFYEEDGVDIYAVDRVSGTHYGIMKIDGELNISFKNCSPVCLEVKP